MTLFVGSSSIRMWRNADRYFKTLKGNKSYLNRGFGGSQVCHLIINNKVIFKGANTNLNPKRIVLYSGDNDLGSGLSAETTRDHFVELINSVRAMGIKAPIYLLTVKPSPKRTKLIGEMQMLISLLENEYANRDDVTVINTFEFFFNDNGSLKKELYQNDGLHLKPAAYKYWAARLEEAWNQ